MSRRADTGDARRAPVAVLGAGSWGTALAMHLGRVGVPVRLWARDPDLAASMRARRENPRYLPGAALPDGVSVTADAGALRTAALSWSRPRTVEVVLAGWASTRACGAGVGDEGPSSRGRGFACRFWVRATRLAGGASARRSPARSPRAGLPAVIASRTRDRG